MQKPSPSSGRMEDPVAPAVMRSRMRVQGPVRIPPTEGMPSVGRADLAVLFPAAAPAETQHQPRAPRSRLVQAAPSAKLLVVTAATATTAVTAETQWQPLSHRQRVAQQAHSATLLVVMADLSRPVQSAGGVTAAPLHRPRLQPRPAIIRQLPRLVLPAG